MMFMVMFIGGTALYTLIRHFVEKKYGYQLPLPFHSMYETSGWSNAIGVAILLGSMMVVGVTFSAVWEWLASLC